MPISSTSSHPFTSIAEVDAGPEVMLTRTKEPVVLRQGATAWPCVQTWTFESLANNVPDRTVRLVQGNRERDRTTFRTASLRSFLRSVASADTSALREQGYLKEIDLRWLSTNSRSDCPVQRLLPWSHVRAPRGWIGSAGTKTGLHRDLLDNIAIQVIGRKRWYFAQPGSIEGIGAVSSKYDAWAILSATSIEELLAQDPYRVDMHAVDVGPGDVLRIPAGWWHQVINLDNTLGIGCFHGPASSVLATGAMVVMRNLLHQIGLVGRDACTCHSTRLSRSG